MEKPANLRANGSQKSNAAAHFSCAIRREGERRAIHIRIDVKYLIAIFILVFLVIGLIALAIYKAKLMPLFEFSISSPSQILLLIGSISAISISIYCAIHDKHKWWYVLLTFVAGFCVYLGTLYASSQQAKTEKDNLRLSQKLIDLQINQRDRFYGAGCSCHFHPFQQTNDIFSLQILFCGISQPIFDLQASIH